MAYNVDLYINSSDKNVMNKNITFLATAECEFKTPLDIENPTIYLNADVAYTACNYIYIAQFGRYYYAKPTGGTSNTVTLTCQSDPLMSFKTGILASKAVVSRNAWHYDKYISDGSLPVESRTVKATFNFPNDPFNGANNCYILTILGCGS